MNRVCNGMKAGVASPPPNEGAIRVVYPQRPLALVVWPSSRSSRIAAFLCGEAGHEEADGFTFARDNGLGLATLDLSPYPLNWWRRSGSILAGLDLVRTLKMLKNYRSFDAVVSIDTSSSFFFALAKRLLGLRKPLIVVDPAMDLGSRIRRWIHRMVLSGADRIVVFTTAQVRYIRNEYGAGARVTFIPHRMDVEFFQPLESASGNTDKPYILSVGDDAGRDFDLLLDAVEGLEIRVLLRTRRKLSRPLPPNANLIGEYLSFEELRILYRDAAFVVVPLKATLHASGINTLLEAMAMGKAVIANQSPGIEDYVQDGRTAWLVPPGNREALRHAITTLYPKKDEQERLGNAARAYCERVCAMPVYMSQMAKIIREAVACA